MDYQNHSRAPPAKTARTAKTSLSTLSAPVPALPSAMPSVLSVLSVSAKAPLPSAETALSPDRDLHGVPAGRRGNAEKN